MNVALDTDIGSDVDDLLALATIFGSPELDLTAVCTVYGDTLLRAQMVARLYRAAGRQAPPIIPGRSEARSGRDVWWAGHEGELMPDLGRENVSDADAVATLAAAKTVIAIGPLTNVAEALEQPDCQIKRLFVMGGDFPDGIEHNIRCDAAAARVIFETGRSATVIGIDQTRRTKINEAAILAIESAGDFGELVGTHVRHYWKVTDQVGNTPHDPLAVLMITNPELFTFATGAISVSKKGKTSFEGSEDGPHRIVTDLDPDTVAAEIVRRISAVEGLS